MTGIERMTNILNRKPVDRIGVFEHFWEDTREAYESQGHIMRGELLEDHFGLDMQEYWAFNLTADLDYKPVTIEETDETILEINGNGAYLRRHKLHDATPEHVKYTVTDREGWVNAPVYAVTGYIWSRRSCPCQV